MSDVVRHIGGAEVLRLTGNRAMVSGTVAQVNAVLAGMRQRGLLFVVSEPQPIGNERIMLTCRLLPEVQPPEPQRQSLPRWAWATIAGAALAVVGFFGWLAYELLTVVADNVALILVAAAGVGLVLLVLSRACTTVITVRHHH